MKSIKVLFFGGVFFGIAMLNVFAYSDDLEKEYKEFVLFSLQGLSGEKNISDEALASRIVKLQALLSADPGNNYADDVQFFVLLVTLNGAEKINIADDLILRYPRFSLEPWTLKFAAPFLQSRPVVGEGIDQVKLQLLMALLEEKAFDRACSLLKEFEETYPEEEYFLKIKKGLNARNQCVSVVLEKKY